MTRSEAGRKSYELAKALVDHCNWCKQNFDPPGADEDRFQQEFNLETCQTRFIFRLDGEDHVLEFDPAVAMTFHDPDDNWKEYSLPMEDVSKEAREAMIMSKYGCECAEEAWKKHLQDLLKIAKGKSK